MRKIESQTKPVDPKDMVDWSDYNLDPTDLGSWGR